MGLLEIGFFVGLDMFNVLKMIVLYFLFIFFMKNSVKIL